MAADGLPDAEQKPFFAGTYFPKRVRYGQPGLIELLRRVRWLWDTNRKKLLETGDQLTAVITQKKSADRREPDRKLLYGAYRQLQQSFDSVWGGFGAAPKFPTPHNLLFLMRFSQWEEKPQALQMAETTLQSMARGGIFDQIGGGFSRYSTDEKWLIPHFEKMLYDNALLIMAYLAAFRTRKGKHTRIPPAVQRSIFCVSCREYRAGFAAERMQTAAAPEGRYYVFTPCEILSVLGSENGEEFCGYTILRKKAILREAVSRTESGREKKAGNRTIYG